MILASLFSIFMTTIFKIAILISLVISGLTAHAAEPRDPNLVELGNEIVIRLSPLPTDPEQQASFLALTPQEQKAFYIKRGFILTQLVSGLTKPGFKSGIRWAKDKVFALKDYLKNKYSAADIATGEGEAGDVDETENVEVPFTWESSPTKLSEKSKAFVESTVTGLVDNMWGDSTRIAKLNSLGFTFVGGAIANTTLGKLGFVWGKGISMDIGVDFKTGNGYIRFYYDSQRLRNGGLSFDVGLMADVLLHLTDSDRDPEAAIEATHVKLPVVGCFRKGTDYLAWGSQIGVSVVDMVGLWMGVHGFPKLASSLAIGNRALGFATAYSTNLTREPISKGFQVSEKTLRRLGLTKLLEKMQDLREENPVGVRCSDLFAI